MKAYREGAYWFSKLSDSRRCLKYYELKHILKTPIEEQTSADLEFGTAIHAGLHDILTGGDGVETFLFHWDLVQAQNAQYSRCGWKELQELGVTLLNRFISRYAKKFKVFKAEERIFAEIQGIPLEGTPDCIAEYEGVPSIIDFKTSSQPYNKLQVLCEEQLSGYAALAKAAYGYVAKQRLYIIFVKNPKAPRIQVIKATLLEQTLFDTVYNIVITCRDLQERKSFPKNPQGCIKGSFVCPYFETCHGALKENEDE